MKHAFLSDRACMSFSFRSTIQRRRIETRDDRRKIRMITFFQKYNPEKKDWNLFLIGTGLPAKGLSEVQSREEGLKHAHVIGGIKQSFKAFRSTIQRRRIETNPRPILYQYPPLLSEVQSREEGLKRASLELDVKVRITFRSTIQRRRIETEAAISKPRESQNFQKYNPEKKDWNNSVYALKILSNSLSEVQSREEGLKQKLPEGEPR